MREYFICSQNEVKKIHESLAIQIQQIVVARDTLYMVTHNGDLYVSGSNEYSRMGTNTQTSIFEPTKNNNVTDVQWVCSGGINVFLRCKKGIFCCGYNSEHNLGLDDTNDRSSFTLHEALSNLPLAQLIVGLYHTIAVCTDKRVFGFGFNHAKQLANSVHRSIPTPVLIPEFANYDTIIALYYSTLLIKNGQLFVCGEDRKLFGPKGNPSFGEPKLVEFFKSMFVEHVVGSNDHTFVIVRGGKVFASGSNMNGELGVNLVQEIASNTLVPLHNVAQIAAGKTNSFALTCMLCSTCVTLVVDDGHVHYCGVHWQHLVPKPPNQAEPVLRSFVQAPEFVNKKRVHHMVVAYNHAILVTGLHSMYQFQKLLLASTWPREVQILFK
jgi:alpha-tubulin suppressor-like RCC1 family protein